VIVPVIISSFSLRCDHGLSLQITSLQAYRNPRYYRLSWQT